MLPLVTNFGFPFPGAEKARRIRRGYCLWLRLV